ncbi:MAG: L,D-transpeptidase family protein [Verrucomicrobium sp.]|nr:L,D-transpeptidase family protein [Verrucomicrobium sp.]
MRAALLLALLLPAAALASAPPPLVLPMPGTVPNQPRPVVPRGRDYYFDRSLSAVWWNPQPGVPLSRIEVRLSTLKLYAFQGDALVGIAPVSTGKEGHSTPTGRYKVLEKDPNHHSTEYGGFYNAKGDLLEANATPTMTPPEGAHYEPAPMPNFLRLTWDGVGLHAGYLPGYAASHGCIRLPKGFSKDLYDAVTVDTPVDIVP